MTKLRQQIQSGDLGTLLHFEATMTFPNALLLKPEAWRAHKDETPCGGLTPMGVHAIDGMIDLGGEIEQVYCQSFHRVVPVDSDDTTSMLFRMKNGASGYLGTITATGPGFSFQVFGSKGSVRLEGMTHVAGASSEERRTRLFSTGKFQPIKGPAETWDAARLDVTRACLEAFATAASGGTPYLIPTSEMVHGAAVTEAVVKSAASAAGREGRVTSVQCTGGSWHFCETLPDRGLQHGFGTTASATSRTRRWCTPPTTGISSGRASTPICRR